MLPLVFILWLVRLTPSVKFEIVVVVNFSFPTPMAPISRAKFPSTVLPLATLYKPILLSPDIFIGLYEELVLKVLLELSFVSKVKFLSFVVCISRATAFFK